MVKNNNNFFQIFLLKIHNFLTKNKIKNKQLMADKINWSLIKDYESFNTYVEIVDRIGKGTNGVVRFSYSFREYSIFYFKVFKAVVT